MIYFGVWSDVDLFCFSISPAFHCSMSIETVMLNCTGGVVLLLYSLGNDCWGRLLQGAMTVGKMLCIFSVV